MNKKILNLALPNIVTNITVPLLGMVDMALMGHLGDEKYMGALALGTMIFNVLYWAFAFLRMGTSGFTAQAYGRRDLSDATNLLGRSLLVAGAAGVLLIVLQIPIEWVSLRLISSSQGVEQLTSQYFRVRIFAAPATIGLFAFMGWYIGMQNARTPMVIAIVLNVLNILFNLFFVKVVGLKTSGVAWGTLLAQYSGFFLALFFFFRFYKKLLKYLKMKLIVNLRAMRLFFRVNADIFGRMICMIAVFTFFTSSSAKAGDEVLAINSLVLQFFMFFSYLIDGFAYAAEALAGRYTGARDSRQLRRAVGLLFVWGTALALVFTGIYWAGEDFLISLLTSDSGVRAGASSYWIWIVFVPVLSFAAFVWDGVYIGATASKPMLYSVLLGTAVFFFPVYFLTVGFWGNHSRWLALCLFLLTRGVWLTFTARKHIFSLVQSPWRQ